VVAQPNYLCGIAAGANGDFLVHDFEGSPPFVRMKRDGTTRGGFQPKYADGSTFDTRGGVKVAPDGRLWTSDGHALLRLSDSGIVDLVLGRAPQADELGKIAALTIDGRGLIYAVDSRTGSVHVFESDGALLHVCRTEPTDSSGELFDPPITVTDQSHVYLGLGEIPGSSEGRYLHFSADGTRLGTQQLKTQRCYVQPGTGNILALAYDEAYLVNAGGQTIRRIARRPDGNWLEGLDRASVAADGSFAIVSAAGDNSDSPSPTVSLYDAIGAPIRTVSMPPSVGRFPRIAYDGRHLVATGKDRVVIFDSTGSPAQTFTPVIKGEKAPEDKAYWFPFLIANGRELLLFDSENTRLWRYAME
jgi:hypothetical protein